MTNTAFIKALTQHFPVQQLYTDPAECWVYGYDNSRRHHLPEAVIFANCMQDIVTTVALCNEYHVPLTPRGRASSTTGAAVPLFGGVVLSLERMQQILAFEPHNRLIVVEPGVLNATLQNTVKQAGFFWPPDPTSAPYCCIGGNLGTNAAGPRSLKYGTARENTLGLTAVIGSGEILHTGSYTTKSSVGYDFTRLLIGAEGTLGIIGEAILKLTPLPSSKLTLRAFYADVEGAAQAITAIMASPITPCGCEFIDGKAIAMIRQHANAPLPNEAGAMLMIEIDGSPSGLEQDLAIIQAAASNSRLLDLAIAKNEQEALALWSIRKSLSQALRSLSPHKINEDVVVPIAAIATLLNFTEELSQQFTIPIVNFGHAGNGNFHVNLLVDPLDPIQGPKAKSCLNLLFDKVISLRGSLSGEHGVGIEKREYIHKQLDPCYLKLMRALKKQFDPNEILNPGKLFPSQ